MRTLSPALKAEQAKPTRKPLVRVEVATFGHPASVASSALQWSDFAWTRLTSASDSTAPAPHALAIPSDGSVIRIRNASGTLYQQRVTSPSGSSDWSSWTNRGSIPSGHPVAVIARNAEAIIFADDGVNLYRRVSSDCGATWGSWVSMTNTRPCERGIAAAFKSNGDCAVIHASDINDPTSLYIQVRSGGTWSTGLGQISGDYEIYGLALYHDGDWNILALLADGDYIRLARGIYGDGDQYTAGSFSGFEFINSYKARVDYPGMMALRRSRAWRTGRAGQRTATWYERYSAVLQERAVDNLAVDDPFICYHGSLGAVFSFAKDNKPWFYRLRPGTEFKDADWYKAFPLDTTATTGLALACDGTYLYASAANQVWRTGLPGSWSPPSPGSGAGTFYSFPSKDILKITESVEAFSQSELTVTLDNSKGVYNSIGIGSGNLAASLKRGSQVKFSIGYRTTTDLLSVAGYYFIEAIEYLRRPGESLFTLHCIDAWGLLQRYSFNRPVEWNYASDEFTVYQLIDKVIQAVGGSLSYVSRSNDIVSIYPRFDIRTGESGAGVLRRLLSLVPDVIYFIGLTGYIVYPQATDSVSYYLRFPT